MCYRWRHLPVRSKYYGESYTSIVLKFGTKEYGGTEHIRDEIFVYT